MIVVSQAQNEHHEAQSSVDALADDCPLRNPARCADSTSRQYSNPDR